METSGKKPSNEGKRCESQPTGKSSPQNKTPAISGWGSAGSWCSVRTSATVRDLAYLRACTESTLTLQSVNLHEEPPIHPGFRTSQQHPGLLPAHLHLHANHRVIPPAHIVIHQH